MRNEELLIRLTQTQGIAGYEKKVRELIEQEVRPYADELIVDPLGSLIAVKKGKGGPHSKKIMFAAHMDEIGFMVKKIEEDGRLLVCNVGWNWTASAYNTRVVFRNGIYGVVSSMKNIEEQKKQEEERLELQNIYQKQADKIYEIVIKVSLRDHTMKGYFTGEEAFEDIYPFTMFEDFVEKTATHYVHPEDKARFYTVFDLDNMKDVLESSSIEEVLFFRINKPGGDYRYKCFRYSYLGSDTDTIKRGRIKPQIDGDSVKRSKGYGGDEKKFSGYFNKRSNGAGSICKRGTL